MRGSNRSIQAGGLILATMVFSACGSTSNTGDTPSAQPPSAQALASVSGATNTTLGTTAKFDVSISNSPSLGNASASGAYDFVKTQGTMDLTPGGGGGTEQVTFAQAMIYIKESQPTSPSIPWVSANVSELSDMSSTLQQLVLQGATINPQFLLNELKWGATSAAPAGSTTVNGAQASRYVVSVDLKRAKKMATGTAGSIFSASIASQLTTVATLSEIIDVDSAQHVVQIEVQPPGDVGKVVITLHSFGNAVPVATPPADQVNSLSPSETGQNDKSSGPEAGGS